MAGPLSRLMCHTANSNTDVFLMCHGPLIPTPLGVRKSPFVDHVDKRTLFLLVFRYHGVLGPEFRGVQQSKLLLTNKFGDQAKVDLLGETECVTATVL